MADQNLMPISEMPSSPPSHFDCAFNEKSNKLGGLAVLDIYGPLLFADCIHIQLYIYIWNLIQLLIYMDFSELTPPPHH